jgi:hypothetical protein
MMPDKITTLYAFVATEQDGTDGIPACCVGDMYFPLVGADKERITSLEPAAQDAANKTGNPVRLVRFHQMEVLRTIEPQ